MVFRLRRYDHITDALAFLHWLRVPQRVDYVAASVLWNSLPPDTQPFASLTDFCHKPKTYLSWSSYINACISLLMKNTTGINRCHSLYCSADNIASTLYRRNISTRYSSRTLREIAAAKETTLAALANRARAAIHKLTYSTAYLFDRSFPDIFL